jgi:hypothetical protein
MPQPSDFPLRTISGRDVYTDVLGHWVIMDDNPESDQVLLIPLPLTTGGWSPANTCLSSSEVSHDAHGLQALPHL